MNQELKIDEQLRDLFPPLTKEEFGQLEKNIIRDGCREPIATWNGYIVDGHNRYNICTKNNIKFQSFVLGYNTKEEVIQWMIDTQLGRRNLTPIQRVSIAEKYRPVLKKLADDNLKLAEGGDRKSEDSKDQGWQKSSKVDKPIHTRDELAKIAGVSHDTYNKAKKILDYEKDKEDKKEDLNEKEKQIINEVKTGEKKVNTAFNELFDKPKTEKKEKVKSRQEISNSNTEEEQEQNNNKKCLKCGIIKDISDFNKNMDFCNDCLKEINNPIQKVEDYSKLGQEEQDVIKGMKTEKLVSDYLIISDELLSIKNNIQEQIDIANDRIFKRYNLPDKISTEDKNSAIVYMNELIEELTKLKNKLINIKIKGE